MGANDPRRVTRLCGFKDIFFFHVFPIKSLCQILTPEAWPIWTLGAWFAVLIKDNPKHCYIQNITALGLMVSEKMIILCYPFVSQWKLYVAMETRVLIRSGPKPNAFPHPNGASDKVWLRLVRWLRRYSCLKVWTDGHTDAGSMVIL